MAVKSAALRRRERKGNGVKERIGKKKEKGSREDREKRMGIDGREGDD